MTKKRVFTVLSILVVLLIICVLMYNYTFNSKHRDIAKEKASLALVANKLHDDFVTDEGIATSKYLDKVIEITGAISDAEESGIILNDKIVVGLIDTMAVSDLVNGSTMTIKGRCVGYDELLEMVKIDQATIIKK